jgi:hypothetical protein
MCSNFLLRNIEHHVAEHLDQAAIGVIGKAGIIAALGQRFDGLVVEAEVQNGVHHAGHGELCAGANRNQQRIVARAQLLPCSFSSCSSAAYISTSISG